MTPMTDRPTADDRTDAQTPARLFRDAADAYEQGDLVTAQMVAGRALDALLADRGANEDLVSDLADALENLSDHEAAQFPAAARDDETDVPTSWGQGGLHRDDVPALLAREFATIHGEVRVEVAPELPGTEDHHYRVDFELVDEEAGPR